MEPRHHTVKKMKSTPGLSLRRFYVMIGKRMITSEAEIQLLAVE